MGPPDGLYAIVALFGPAPPALRGPSYRRASSPHGAAWPGHRQAAATIPGGDHVRDLPLVNTPTVMKTTRELTAIIEREGDGYVALCPEVDVASQGDTVEEARANLIEALELFFETASPNELLDRLHEEVLVTRVKVAV